VKIANQFTMITVQSSRSASKSYLPLNGMHRFSNDLTWGMLLFRLRNGSVAKEDIQLINTRVMNSSTMLPANIHYATYYNHDCDAINTALFKNDAVTCPLVMRKFKISSSF
jgi:hypothetical protein